MTKSDCSRKPCPRYMSKNNWAEWIKFKALVAVKLKGGTETMTEKDVVKIVNSVVDEAINKSIRPGIKEGVAHWSDDKQANLEKKHGIKIHERRPNDLITRGEVVSISDDIMEAVDKKIAEVVSKNKECGCCGK